MASIVTAITTKRFEFEIAEGTVDKPVAKKEVQPSSRTVTEEEAEAWARELDAEMKKKAAKEEFDGPAYVSVMQGLHRMQVRGCTAADETRFLRLHGFEC